MQIVSCKCFSCQKWHTEAEWWCRLRMSLHGPGLMPTVAAAPIHTDQLINGNAFDHIIRPVRHEKAIAFPAAPRILWGALFHPPIVYQLAGTSSIGKISRGKLAAGRYPSDGKRDV